MADTRELWYDLARIYFPVMIGVFVLVTAALLYPALRYRNRTEPPSQRSEAPRVEIALTTVLLATAIGLAVITLRADAKVAEPKTSADALQVKVTGARWRWRFDYPQLGITETGGEPKAAQLVVPRGRLVAFTGTALDVSHSLWLEERRFKRDVMPGYVNRWGITFTEAGRSYGRCAEFCGTYHPAMNVDVIVLEPAAFDRWTARRRAELARSGGRTS